MASTTASGLTKGPAMTRSSTHLHEIATHRHEFKRQAGRHRLRRLAAVPTLAILGLGSVLAVGPPVHATTKSTTKTTPSRTTLAVDPNAPEVQSPGDIPDDIAFVPYRPVGAAYTITTPEGWPRRTIPGGAVFTDKYNIIQVESITTTTAPTPSSVRAELVARLAKAKGFKLGSITTVKRKAGAAFLATYLIRSAPNEVTGKTLVVAVERYEFHRGSVSVVLTLSGAKGADNVDPWKIVTDSFTWA